MHQKSLPNPVLLCAFFYKRIMSGFSFKNPLPKRTFYILANLWEKGKEIFKRERMEREEFLLQIRRKVEKRWKKGLKKGLEKNRMKLEGKWIDHSKEYVRDPFMKKKILSLLLAVVLLASTMVVALAAYEVDQFDLHLSVPESASAMLGLVMADYKNNGTDVDIRSVSPEWTNVTDGVPVSSETDFAAGKTYRVKLVYDWFVPDQFTLTDDFRFTVYEETAESAGWENVSFQRIADAANPNGCVGFEIVMEHTIPGGTSSGGSSSDPDDNTSSAPAEPEETTPTVPSVRPGNGSGEEEVIWQWSDSQKTEGQKNNPSTGDSFQSAVSVLMAAAALASVGMLLGKKR
ncbi:MAG: LPXTG cell wall anchor domain-containing protein [Oscillospiraceae bacterium]|nr:LPXTG cell wall anchor domain-containing protein [Oscillospiraceae bacterium]